MRIDDRNAVARTRNYYWKNVNPHGSYADLLAWLGEKLNELDQALEAELETPDPNPNK